MYLDPGFGSMIIQVVIAGIATIGVSLYVFKSKIRALFNKEGKTNSKKDEE